MKYKLFKFTCFAFFLGSFSASADAEQKFENLRIRAKIGNSWVTNSAENLGQNISKVSAGLDFTHRFHENFDLTASLDRAFLWDKSHITFLGLTPSAAIDHDLFHFYLGAFAGAMFTEFHFNAYPYYVSNTRFALGPVLGADANLTDYIFAHASVRFLHAIGPDDSLNTASLFGGVGVRF